MQQIDTPLTDSGQLVPNDEERHLAQDDQIFFEFDIGKTTLMVDHEVYCEYVRSPQIYRLPLMPDWLQGLINVRGMLVPVIRLDKLSQGDSDQNTNHFEHALIMDRNVNAAAILINQPPRVARYSKEDCKHEISTLPNLPSGICLFEYIKEDKHTYVIDHRALFESLSEIELNRQSGQGWSHTGSTS